MTWIKNAFLWGLMLQPEEETGEAETSTLAQMWWLQYIYENFCLGTI
jgi:hypothetical protein